MVGEWAELRFRSRVEDRGSRIEDRGSRIEDRGSRIEDRGSRIEDRLACNDAIFDPRSSILDPLPRVPLFPRVAAFSIRPNASRLTAQRMINLPAISRA